MPSFPTPGPVTLSIELASGSVDVHATDTDRTEVELTPARVGDDDAAALIDQARVSHGGDTVTVHVPEGRRSGFLRRTPDIVMRITVPAGSSLEASVRSADLRGRGRFGDVRVASSSGDVSISEIVGDLRLDVASGDVRVGHVTGDVRAKSASGDVQVEACGGAAWAQSASGDIRLVTVTGDAEIRSASGDVTIDEAGGSMSIRTASGDVRVGDIPAGRTEINAVSGDVQVSVVPGLAVWLDVNSLSGDVRSTLAPAADDAPAGETLELAVHTVSGDIAITPGRLGSATTPPRKDTP